MPCGGIYPVGPADVPCFLCNESGADHALIEWDAALHGKCVQPFLNTDEGQIVLNHKHWVIVELGAERKVMHRGDELEYFVTQEDIDSGIRSGGSG
jgi:hypothetical protein